MGINTIERLTSLILMAKEQNIDLSHFDKIHSIMRERMRLNKYRDNKLAMEFTIVECEYLEALLDKKEYDA